MVVFEQVDDNLYFRFSKFSQPRSQCYTPNSMTQFVSVYVCYLVDVKALIFIVTVGYYDCFFAEELVSFVTQIHFS